jgi:hypothetical protein
MIKNTALAVAQSAVQTESTLFPLPEASIANTKW